MSLLAILQIGCVVAFALLLVAAGWQDLRTMRIGNGLSISIVASFALWSAAGLALGQLSLVDLGLAIACATAVFALAVAGFAAGAMGGGDVKLLTAASLFAGPAHQLDFLTITALAGGVLAIALLAGAPIGPIEAPGGAAIRTRLRGGLPYGPAIAAGGLWVAATLVIV
jgi:prepilin peptidase CpaA